MCLCVWKLVSSVCTISIGFFKRFPWFMNIWIILKSMKLKQVINSLKFINKLIVARIAAQSFKFCWDEVIQYFEVTQYISEIPGQTCYCPSNLLLLIALPHLVRHGQQDHPLSYQQYIGPLPLLHIIFSSSWASSSTRVWKSSPSPWSRSLSAGPGLGQVPPQ